MENDTVLTPPLFFSDDFPQYTQHCWLVECRGCVGETVFHVCFLMGTPVHMHLAKRLLKHFPLLLNDVYLSEEYYGENVLHMAAVAEDPSIVKVNTVKLAIFAATTD